MRLIPLFAFAILCCGEAGAEVSHPGEGHYRRICFVCHDRNARVPGSQGAPRLGDNRAWESRIPLGVDTLFARITLPHPSREPMPRAGLSDSELRLALQYMLYMADPFGDPVAGM